MKKSRIVPILLYFVLSSMLIIVWWIFEKRNISEHRNIATSLSEQVALRIGDNINHKLSNMDVFRDEWENTPLKSKEKFSERVEKILNSTGGFHSINYIDIEGNIVFLSESKGHIWGIQSNMLDTSDQALYDTFSLARKTGDITISSVYEISNNRNGYIIFFPIKNDGVISGYLNCVLSVDKIVNYCLSRGSFKEYVFYIDDLQNEIYSSIKTEQIISSEILGSYAVPVFNRFWTVYVALTPWAVKELLSLSSKIILIFGLLVIFWISWTVKNFLELK
ncbi:MAG: cache domain-containing protein [Candidatus Marinimicrobia bacterium]|jgi:sensor domain CHASE-containing protein|nr:cache domain-containing protein [Candidatus Neomarinimicrobiota bacterium]MBT3633144.1 cache domain-containing protein [Candidatus Neomarinimicrobiota bacterium]MBT3682255.1 cache domain-containing protein [Candidatus Neomarinimicrobiota bacterium]MBT3758744.1 cache domain-containing protein [Candidatus Neomarinimicrobiota bacterium]MBT3895382.1 cache domain-containing protein [Candidatus Neomarinimicrobiota bacterium]